MYLEVQRELLGLLLERLARLLHLAVLALHLLVLLGEQLRLFLQLLVGLLQLLLAALQLFGERLRLLEQVLRAHVGLDRVDHDADGFRELVEEGLVGRVEAARTTRARARPRPAPSNTIGSTRMLSGVVSPSPETMRDRSRAARS